MQRLCRGLSPFIQGIWAEVGPVAGQDLPLRVGAVCRFFSLGEVRSLTRTEGLRYELTTENERAFTINEARIVNPNGSASPWWSFDVQ